MSQRTTFFSLMGGMDLVTPAIAVPDGRVRASVNHEPDPRGYRRIDGYERFDGRGKPSDATYWVLRFTAGTAEIAAGSTVTGAASGATGTALVVGVAESGAYADGNAAGYLVLTGVTGVFVDGENLSVSGVTRGRADGEALERGASTDDDDAVWRHAAIEAARSLIQPVPGSGPVRGVWVFKGDTYAVRDNAGGTTGVMHKATSSGWQVVTSSLPPGGRYEFVTHNFFGASNMAAMYGCNGVGKAFSYDGTSFSFITTGMAIDAPKHIAVHKNHLFLTFSGGSVQHSAVGDPTSWAPILGAGEIGIGEEVTGLLPSVAGVMAIFGRNKIAMLYGDDAANWELKFLSDEAGAIEWTPQTIGSPIYLDDRGIRSLTATQSYGDFRMGTMSALVEPIFKKKRANGVTAVASVRLREKDQYRLFWSDGTALAMYVGRKMPEILPLDYGEAVVRSICVGEDSDGREIAFFGSDDGHLYQLDSGTSFDGAAIPAYIRLAYNHVGSPRQDKRWHKVALELTAAPSTSIGITAEFSYGNPDLPAGQEETFSVSGGGGAWDEDEWNRFYWSATAEGVAEAEIAGIGTNVSVVVVSESTYDDPYTLHGITLYYSPRRLVR